MSRRPFCSFRLILPLVLLPLLGGCINDSAGYLINGARHAIAIERRQDYFWQKQVQLSVIVSRLPDCQRKHALQKAGPKTPVELWQPGPGTFIFKVGNRAYVTETQTCRSFAELDEDPPGGFGRLVGTFALQDGIFSFIPEPEPEEETPAVTP